MPAPWAPRRPRRFRVCKVRGGRRVVGLLRRETAGGALSWCAARLLRRLGCLVCRPPPQPHHSCPMAVSAADPVCDAPAFLTEALGVVVDRVTDLAAIIVAEATTPGAGGGRAAAGGRAGRLPARSSGTAPATSAAAPGTAGALQPGPAAAAAGGAGSHRHDGSTPAAGSLPVRARLAGPPAQPAGRLRAAAAAGGGLLPCS